MNKQFVISTLVATLICSCSSKDNSAEYSVLEASGSEVPVTRQKENLEITEQRKLIKEGDIIFETNDLNRTRSIINEATENLNGYISNDNEFAYGNKLEHRIVIRIPSSNFDELLDRILEGAKEIESKTVRVLDVTEEYIDVKARLATKKEIENRYKELLKKANTVEEILAIEKELGILREEIESVEGRLRYLNDRISFSTLTVTYYQEVGSAFKFGNKFNSKK